MINNKGYTIFELIIAMTMMTIASIAIFNGIQTLSFNANENKLQRDTYTEITQGVAKLQKIIYENANSIDVPNPDTYINDGEILNFIKEDDSGIEKTYFLEYDNNCINGLGTLGFRLLISDGLNDTIPLTKCMVKNSNLLEVKAYFIDTNLKENLVNLDFSVENKLSKINDHIKSTIFIK